MAYFSYHRLAKSLIRKNKLVGYTFAQNYGKISPALILIFDDLKHPIMPIRQHRWDEYIPLLPEEKEMN